MENEHLQSSLHATKLLEKFKFTSMHLDNPYVTGFSVAF